jgi:hypothetical protein
MKDVRTGVSENRELRKMFEPNREKLGCRKEAGSMYRRLDLYFLLSVFRVVRLMNFEMNGKCNA